MSIRSLNIATAHEACKQRECACVYMRMYISDIYICVYLHLQVMGVFIYVYIKRVLSYEEESDVIS